MLSANQAKSAVRVGAANMLVSAMAVSRVKFTTSFCCLSIMSRLPWTFSTAASSKPRTLPRAVNTASRCSASPVRLVVSDASAISFWDNRPIPLSNGARFSAESAKVLRKR